MSSPETVMPFTEVDAPMVEAPAGSLLSLARSPALSDDRWLAGYEYLVENARVVHNRSGITSTVGDNLRDGEPSELVKVMPCMLEIVDDYTGFEFNTVDYPERAKRLLEAYSSKLLEHELWTGEIADADSLPNKRLASPDAEEVTGSPLSPQRAVARLMQALATAGVGEGMIHVSKEIAILLPDNWRNEETYERFGFVVVGGAGYPGTGPDGTGTDWMYATEMCNVRLGNIDILPDDKVSVWDRGSNTATYRAQRYGAVDFAGGVFACQVTES